MTSVFGRTGDVIAQSGDYTADQITETATRVFVTPAEKTAITHTNRTILDAIEEALTTSLKTNYDTAYTHSQIIVGNPHGTTHNET